MSGGKAAFFDSCPLWMRLCIPLLCTPPSAGGCWGTGAETKAGAHQQPPAFFVLGFSVFVLLRCAGVGARLPLVLVCFPCLWQCAFSLLLLSGFAFSPDIPLLLIFFRFSFALPSPVIPMGPRIPVPIPVLIGCLHLCPRAQAPTHHPRTRMPRHVVTAVRKGGALPCATVRPLQIQPCATVRPIFDRKF